MKNQDRKIKKPILSKFSILTSNWIFMTAYKNVFFFKYTEKETGRFTCFFLLKQKKINILFCFKITESR